MNTTIMSNGGGRTYPIEALFERLNTDTLDRTFEAFGDFIMSAPVNMRGEPMTAPGGVLFFGNFATYSHVFNILTDDADLIERLSAAILANKERPEYLAQPPYFDGRKLAIKEHRRSTTQGEVELIYDGESIGRFGDKIQLNGRGQWIGYSPQFWTDTARRVMADRHTAANVKETTASLREGARQAEKRLDWSVAAGLWTKAAESYPQPYPKLGALAQRDVQAMLHKASTCERMAAALVAA